MTTMNINPSISEADYQAHANLEVIRADDQVTIVISGTWTGPTVHVVDEEMRGLEQEKFELPVAIDMSAIERLDTAGAWIVHRLKFALDTDNQQVDVVSNDKRHLELLRAVDVELQEIERPKRDNILVWILSGIGKTIYGFGSDFIMASHIIGASIRGAQMKPGKSGGIRPVSIVHQMEVMGLQAVPIIALMSFLIGVIIAQQGALQLKVFGAEIFVVDLVGILHLREIGVLLTAIMVAGRTGSAITAELGSMKMREEIDALTVMGLNPVGVLILPRIVALMLVLPMLVVVSDIFGMLGAIVISWLYVDITPALFISNLRIAIDMTTVLSGLFKAPVMALIIGLVASIEGMKVSGSAESLGKHTTAAVVKAIFVVIVVDGLFAIFYGAIDY